VNGAKRWLGGFQRIDSEGVERTLTPLRDLEVMETAETGAEVVVRFETSQGEVVRVFLPREQARSSAAELTEKAR